jgi:hypothetical protein
MMDLAKIKRIVEDMDNTCPYVNITDKEKFEKWLWKRTKL